MTAAAPAACPTFSFELFPPRDAAAEAALVGSALPALVAAGPEFISVTYGASGSTRGVSLDVLRRLLATPVKPMAHLTCVGSSYAEASRLIREFLDAGVTSFLALRGDPPAGVPEEEIFLGDLGSAGELVQLIHRVQKERVPFRQVELPGLPGAKRIASGEKVTIAVAAFPNGHPRSRSRAQDLDTLLAKEAAGANLAITQLFFEADEFHAFVADARAAGVTMRILPGIMPMLSVPRLRRILELTGEREPTALLRALEASDDPFSVGVDHAIRLGRALLDGGAPGLHLYTFNRHEAPLAVLDGAGLLPLTTPTGKTS
ncbi:methylenetetrahydrofolate reductase [Protaetiibacter intestinalis]|uniref:Methylenetetrahydrofolate reductase n=1 Tax=Protaetiibacter intestinalis TaxID=2419774 RepID=A0A387B323_9MICO|nr:methylenetetrahydrofolate reductase [Protaetiibacter intestinalis]AYF96803.1 5,10-methylenetetrahydrofolate reductase [Protaetiibacter intestinalis]